MKKSLEYCLQLRYPMEIVQSKGGGYFAQIVDLPGCTSEGDTPAEAVANLEEAKRAWIEACLEDNQEVPLPHDAVPEYSGKFVVRLPKSLHRELAIKSQHEGVSLNQYVVHLVSLALGYEQMAGRNQAVDADAIAQVIQKSLTSWCPRMHAQLGLVSFLEAALTGGSIAPEAGDVQFLVAYNNLVPTISAQGWSQMRKLGRRDLDRERTEAITDSVL